jgi:hypothetical protein
MHCYSLTRGYSLIILKPVLLLSHSLHLSNLLNLEPVKILRVFFDDVLLPPVIYQKEPEGYKINTLVPLGFWEDCKEIWLKESLNYLKIHLSFNQ